MSFHHGSILFSTYIWCNAFFFLLLVSLPGMAKIDRMIFVFAIQKTKRKSYRKSKMKIFFCWKLKIELRLLLNVFVVHVYVTVCVCHLEGLNYLDRISSGFIHCLWNFLKKFYLDHVECWSVCKETSIFEWCGIWRWKMILKMKWKPFRWLHLICCYEQDVEGERRRSRWRRAKNINGLWRLKFHRIVFNSSFYFHFIPIPLPFHIDCSRILPLIKWNFV